MNRIALSLALSLVPLLAHAGGPESERFDFAYDGEPMADCGGFEILLYGAGTSHLTWFRDRDGAPRRVTLHGHYSGMMVNPLNGNTLFDAPSVAMVTLDVQSGVQTSVGTYWNVTVPGRGVIALEAGRLVFDGDGPPVFIAGPHLPPPQTIALLCDALR